MSLWQRAKDFAGWESSPKNSKVGSILDAKVTQKTIVAIGTTRAGKTTHFAGLGKVAQYRSSESAKTDRPFRFHLREGHTNMRDDIAELSTGHFPAATGLISNTTLKPGFTFEWEEPTLFGSMFKVKRQALMPVIDFAGEQLVLLNQKVRAAKTFKDASAIQGVDQLTMTVNQASALLPIINAERAEGLPIFKPDPSHDKIKGLSKHPDVNLARMLDPILEFKHDNKDYTPPLEKFIVIVTACDVLFPIAQTITNITGRPFDPLNPAISHESLDSFMRAFFPQTHSLISSMNVDVQYFPSYFELEKDAKGEVQYWDEAKLEPKIKRGNIFDSPDWVHNVNRPKFTEYWFNREIESVKDFAMMV